MEKIRIMLSVDLLEFITDTLQEADIEITNKFVKDLDNINLALFKLNAGIRKPEYTQKELTLEQKVTKGIATEEELLEYEEQLMKSI